MMEEYWILTLVETLLLFYFWPKWMATHRGYNNTALLDDNPHLRICYAAKKWITPTTFLSLAAGAAIIGRSFQNDLIEIFFLNILVVITALVIGTMISIIIVDRFKSGNYNKLT